MLTDTSTRGLAARCVCLLAAAAIVFELFYAGARPPTAGWLFAPWDKVAHFALYSTIAALLWAAAAGRMSFALVVVVILVGALDELHQAGLPGRTSDTADFLADSLAVTATIGLLSAWTRSRRNEEPKGKSCAA